MVQFKKELLEYIDARLATMIRCPGTWGSNEALELQCLQFLEMRMFILETSKCKKDPYRARDKFMHFIDLKFPGSNLFLSNICKNNEEFYKLIKELIEYFKE